MSVRGDIHHLDLTVADPEASRTFYDAVLGFMGYQAGKADETGIDYDLIRSDMPFLSIGLVKAKTPRTHDRFTSGLHHVAWRAESRADVDALYAMLLKIGATILYAPADYPEYGAGYYAVFFSDPDGLKLEYVFKP